MNKLVGSYYVLAKLPVWAIAGILFAVTQLPIIVGRDFLEGIPYQVAYSAVIGDVCLALCVLVAAAIIQDECTHIPMWLQGKTHIMILVTSVLVGSTVCFFTLDSRSGQGMDIYHDVVIAPLFLYLAVTLLPVIYYSGTRSEKRWVVGFIAFWLVLVGFDVKYDRMNQRRWLHNNIDFIEQMK